MISERIEKDYIEAYKAKNEELVSVLRLLKSALKNAEIASKGELSEATAIATLKRELKQRKESAEEYRKMDKNEVAQKEEYEAGVISSYLPQQLSEADVEKIVDEAIAKLGVSDPSGMGKVIGLVMADYGSQTDGGTVSKIAASKLRK